MKLSLLFEDRETENFIKTVIDRSFYGRMSRTEIDVAMDSINYKANKLGIDMKDENIKKAIKKHLDGLRVSRYSGD